MKPRPIHIFRPSLALQYVSRRGRCENSVAVTSDTRVAIEAALEAQRSIKLSYSQLQFGISDFVWRGRSHPAYRELLQDFGTSIQGTLGSARALLLALDPPPPTRDQAFSVIQMFEDRGEALAAVVHGFTEVRERKRNELRFYFRFRRAQRCFTTGELETMAERLSADAKAGLEILTRLQREAFSDIHRHGHRPL